MKKIYFLLLIAISFFIKAQDITYEKIDSISADISQYQLKSENLFYNDGKDSYELSFPENNFQIFYSTKKATKVVNKRIGDKEFICITENIDLSKADEVFRVQYPGQAGVVRINFPEGVKTQIYTNGIYTDTIREYYLEFFYNRNDEGSDKELLTRLDGIFSSLKLGNKIPKEQFLIQERSNSIKKEITDTKELRIDDVVEKYIRALGGAEKIQSINSVFAEGIIETQGFQIPVKIWFLHNEGLRMDMEIQGKANTTVVTKNSSWTLFPMQNQKKPVDADSAVAREGAEELDSTGDLFDYKAKGNTAELLGKETINGNDFYKVRLTRKSGTVVSFLIDSNTFFVTKKSINKNIQGNIVEVVETIGNYKKNSDGYVYASSFQYSPAGTNLIYSSYQVNKSIDPKLFEKP